MMAKTNKNIIRKELNLDIERTLLAQKRTFLSYIRTALSIFTFSVFLYKFFGNELWVQVVTVLSLICGAVSLGYGAREYFRIKSRKLVY